MNILLYSCTDYNIEHFIYFAFVCFVCLCVWGFFSGEGGKRKPDTKLAVMKSDVTDSRL